MTTTIDSWCETLVRVPVTSLPSMVWKSWDSVGPVVGEIHSVSGSLSKKEPVSVKTDSDRDATHFFVDEIVEDMCVVDRVWSPISVIYEYGFISSR